MVSESTKKTLILSVSAIVGLTTISTLAYLLIQDDKKAQHLRKIRSLQRSLQSRLHKVDTAIETLVKGDIRQANVRVYTLHSHAIYPADHKHNASNSSINEEESDLHEKSLKVHKELEAALELTAEELAKEQAQGFEKDSAKVRQAYKRLDFLINSCNEQLLRLLESLDAISPRELTDLGDGFGGLATANGPEVAAFEKVKKRKRALIAKIHAITSELDKVGAHIKHRVSASEQFEQAEAKRKVEAEKQAREAAELEKQARDAAELEKKLAKEAAEEAAKKKKEEEEEAEKEREAKAKVQAEAEAQAQKETDASETLVNGKTASYSEAHHGDKDEVLAYTDDLALMKEGVTFADMAKVHLDEQVKEQEQKAQDEKEEKKEEERNDSQEQEDGKKTVVEEQEKIESVDVEETPSSSVTSSYADINGASESAVLVDTVESQ
ncbi:hypothetical protein BGZ94_007284 [Podila epigama]|nr:hypothetical protein BGZ94_007284 [Podila epigama]